MYHMSHLYILYAMPIPTSGHVAFACLSHITRGNHFKNVAFLHNHFDMNVDHNIENRGLCVIAASNGLSYEY